MNHNIKSSITLSTSRRAVAARLFFGLALASSGLYGCSPSSHSGNSLFDIAGGIFSTRPQNFAQSVVLLKLNTPAMLEGVELKNGQPQLDNSRLQAIQAEQTALIAQLAKISTDIKVLFQYKMVLNAVAVAAPVGLVDSLNDLGNIVSVESNNYFARSLPLGDGKAPAASGDDFNAANSVKWIGAETLHKQGILGQGIRIGIIDTGIDYTHAMLGGPGTSESYKSIDPAKPTPLFPNKKVVGGIDLAGTNFSPGSPIPGSNIPQPDSNPLDEAGHGSHVSGTVAGKGDGTTDYDGVAPEALLYGIKVFGKSGGTDDVVVIAALEYASDPTGKGTGEGRMDVVNLSLGSPFGLPHTLYGEAAKNLILGGTVMLAAAGNEGAVPYIVGSPSEVTQVISVAANIDNTYHNWHFAAGKFVGPSQTFETDEIEGDTTKAIADAGDVHGKLVDIGLANADLTADQVAALKGNVALITRGQVSFDVKLGRAADAGAIGVVMINSVDGDPIAMGGTGKFNFPAFMVTQASGKTISDEMKKGDVVVYFQTSDKIAHPEMVDNIAGFSSQGPRGADGYLKPEITAPGFNVISVKMGSGNEAVQMSGTSMATPHMTGAMALLRQMHPDLSPLELKSMIMGRTRTLSDRQKNVYSVTRQGAGMVQVDVAASSPVVANKVSLSLGEQNIETKKVIRDSIQFRNITKTAQQFQIVFETASAVQMTGPTSLSLAAGESQQLDLSFLLDATKSKDSVIIFEGWLKLLANDKSEVFRVPMLAISHRISQVSAGSLLVRSTSQADSAGSAVDLTLTNSGQNAGRVFLFNLLGTNSRVPDPTHDKYKNHSCELQSAGYRVIKKTIDGNEEKILQVAVKLFDPETNWNTCEIEVLIGGNTNGIADQELVLTQFANLAGTSPNADSDYQIASLLLDAGKARAIRAAFEKASNGTIDPKNPPKEDYTPALLDALPSQVYNNSTIAIVEANVTNLAVTPTGELQIKVDSTSDDESSLVSDDYLGTDLSTWRKISLSDSSQSFAGLPAEVDIAAGQTVQVPLTKGEGSDNLLILLPDNRTVQSNLLEDQQQVNATPLYGTFSN